MDKKVGRKWFDFLCYISIPASILIFGLITLVLFMQVITDFSFGILCCTLIALAVVLSYSSTLYGFKRKRKYAVYLYFINKVVYLIVCTFGFGLRRTNFSRGIDIILELLCGGLELYYFSKRLSWFS